MPKKTESIASLRTESIASLAELGPDYHAVLVSYGRTGARTYALSCDGRNVSHHVHFATGLGTLTESPLDGKRRVRFNGGGYSAIDEIQTHLRVVLDNPRIQVHEV